jgi:hypothetical protein
MAEALVTVHTRGKEPLQGWRLTSRPTVTFLTRWQHESQKLWTALCTCSRPILQDSDNGVLPLVLLAFRVMPCSLVLKNKNTYPITDATIEGHHVSHGS